MSYLKMEYHDVDFMQRKDGPALRIDYTQYDFVSEPCRMALIDSRMFGVPFEGYDYYQNGVGGMKGVTNSDGTMEYIPWSAVCSEYELSESGIRYPIKFKAIWNYPDGNFLYFNATISTVSYDE